MTQSTNPVPDQNIAFKRFRRRMAFIVAILAIAVGTLLFMVVARPATNRYQFHTVDKDYYIFDSCTGQMWVVTSSSQKAALTVMHIDPVGRTQTMDSFDITWPANGK
jgi:hypothetical protein